MTSDAEVARRALGLLDLTDLDDECSTADVVALCARGVTPWGHVAAVCVWPRFVGDAVAATVGGPVRVATVANFPSGDEPWSNVGATIDRALADGADEIDVVVPYRRAVSGDVAAVETFLTRVRAIVPPDRIMKTILETGELVDESLIRECALRAVAAGTDFLKTSTGKTRVSATIRSVEILLEVASGADRTVGVKPSGGIRTILDAREYLAAADRVMGPSWAAPSTFRFGTSRLLDAITSELS